MNKNAMLAILKNVQSNNVTVENFQSLSDIITDIEKEIRKETNKKTGSANIQKAAENIIKSAKKNHKAQILLHGSWVKDGKQYVCDKYRALQILQPLDLEKIPEDKGEPYKCENFFVEPGFYPERFSLPTAVELKNMITAAKAAGKISEKKNIVYCCENGPVFNAQYLLDAMTATGATFFETEKSRYNGKYVNVCMFYSEKCNAVVLPLVNPAAVAKNDCIAI